MSVPQGPVFNTWATPVYSPIDHSVAGHVAATPAPQTPRDMQDPGSWYSPPPMKPSKRPQWIAVVLLPIVVAAGGGVYVGYQSAAGDYQPLLQQAQAELAVVQQDIAESQAAADEVPNLKTLSQKHFASSTDVYGDADSLSIIIQTYNMGRDMGALEEFLTELGFSSAVLDRMGKTRALDGAQTAEGKNCNVTWTYHPDNGLGLVFEAVSKK